ncbi:hypothetical protein SAMN05444351_1156 [Geodermatophilus nigrescens]|uniref:Uncharacterized protein n=1 Tax=Geodermatophilus nigrescens TaxID=1070870 RepID=A0A1M5FBB5_9ACTN|nr:hypothetical protein SAMN05444351_1156 [Geodermatophilus nigrescens]
MSVHIDDVDLACRLSGLTLTELWIAYVGMGGSASEVDLWARLALGAGWPAVEDAMLLAAAEEALVNAGLPRLHPGEG